MARGSGGITPIVLALVTDGYFQPLLVTLWRANAACFTSVPPERSPSRLRAVDHRRDAAGFPGKWSPARWQVPRAESDDIQRQCQQATEFELKVLAKCPASTILSPRVASFRNVTELTEQTLRKIIVRQRWLVSGDGLPS